MKIKNSLFENTQYFETFEKIHRSSTLPVMDAYRINRLVKKLNELHNEYMDLKRGLFNKYGTSSKENKDDITIPEDKKEPFFEELQVLLDIEHDLETETLPWPKTIKDGFSSADLGIMEKFFDMDSFENPKVNVNSGVIPQSLKRNVNTPSI